jgi:hypothetical protein
MIRLEETIVSNPNDCLTKVDTEMNFNSIEWSSRLNQLSSIIIVIIGFMINIIGIIVLSIKNYKKRQSVNLYLLILLICDNSFLLVHLFHDTFNNNIYRLIHFHFTTTFQDRRRLIPCTTNITTSLPQHFTENIQLETNYHHSTDTSLKACRVINFIRYVLRFITTYIIMAFILHRTLATRVKVVFQTLNNIKETLFIIVLVIIMGIIANLWVPLKFTHVYTTTTTTTTGDINNEMKYCDIDTENSTLIFFIYIIVFMITPCIIILVCDIFIIKTMILDEWNTQLYHMNYTPMSSISTKRTTITSNDENKTNNPNNRHNNLNNHEPNYNYSSRDSRYSSGGFLIQMKWSIVDNQVDDSTDNIVQTLQILKMKKPHPKVIIFHFN